MLLRLGHATPDKSDEEALLRTLDPIETMPSSGASTLVVLERRCLPPRSWIRGSWWRAMRPPAGRRRGRAHDRCWRRP